MNTRKVKAGEPAPDVDWSWLFPPEPSPEPEPEPEDDMEEIQSRILGTILLSACMFVIVVLWMVFVW